MEIEISISILTLYISTAAKQKIILRWTVRLRRSVDLFKIAQFHYIWVLDTYRPHIRMWSMVFSPILLSSKPSFYLLMER